ncbi:unnamed protein product [Moneuplotes crassus]|uniref:Histidine phosphatase family protein n=1 Tax=Euplotes crassus TaxID=5936 RepID=A0AAD1XWB1_EUPCR|nr:unnamed protein product [Moneuplotes crassus]
MLKINFSGLHSKLSKFMTNASKSKGSSYLLFVRNAESSGNLSGTLTGWMDAELSEYGRKQAFSLNEVLVDYEDEFSTLNCSDLKRSVQTANYALGFPSESDLVQDKLIRECSYGEMEGIHFDSMPDSQKEQISDPSYVFPGGESFNQVRDRGQIFLNKLPEGTHLVFTHAGVICSLLQDYGVAEMPETCSFVGATLDSDSKELKMLEFLWEYPVISEDI